MFFRIKKIKGNEYAYSVENKWKRTSKAPDAGYLERAALKGSRQKVKGYLGRAYRFELRNNVGFFEFLKNANPEGYMRDCRQKQVIMDLAEWELFKFGIRKEGFSIDFDNMQIQKNGRNAVFLINEGFMCSLTLKSLLEFKAGDGEQPDGYRLAKAFVDAGINVPHQVFVAVFGKFYKTAAD